MTTFADLLNADRRDNNTNKENGKKETMPIQSLSQQFANAADAPEFTKSQEKSKTHRHVSAIWAKKCISWDELADQLETSAASNKDAILSADQLSLVEKKEEMIDGDEIRERRVLALKVDDDTNGGIYDFSETSFQQMAGPTFCGLGSRLANVGQDDYEIDRLFDVYKYRFQNVMTERVQDGKKVFVRLRRDGQMESVRALLSERYAVIDHRWIAEVIRSIVGEDALISHFDQKRFAETGGDYVRYNVLISDSIRAESDSDYGGMESVSNSEIGTGRQNILPSVFRAICMNGCIWGQQKDKRFAVSKVHRGKDVDYHELAAQIKSSLNAAIPLLDQGIDQMLALKEFKGNADVMRLTFAIAASEFQLTKDEKRRLLGVVSDESETENVNNAFGALNVFTRYAQQVESLQHQQEIEETCGRLLGRWNEKPETFDLVDRNAMAIDMQKELSILN